MHFVYFAQAVTFLASLSSAALVGRQSATNVYNGTGWIEEIAVRSNGQVLLNRLDTPELWNLDPSTKKATKLLDFPGVLSLSGITEISPDVFAVVTGNMTVTGAISVTAGSWGVWTVDLTDSTPKATLVTLIPEAGFLIGLAPLNDDTLFVADAGKGAIYSLTLSTGAYSLVVQDASMLAPSSAPIQEGIHGLKYHDGNLYFSNTFGNTFNRIAVIPGTGKTSGSVVTILDNLQGPEDFVVGPDGSPYLAQLTNGTVIKVSADGRFSTVVSTPNCNSVAFGRTAEDNSTLYISTSQGSVFSVNIT